MANDRSHDPPGEEEPGRGNALQPRRFRGVSPDTEKGGALRQALGGSPKWGTLRGRECGG